MSITTDQISDNTEAAINVLCSKPVIFLEARFAVLQWDEDRAAYWLKHLVSEADHSIDFDKVDWAKVVDTIKKERSA